MGTHINIQGEPITEKVFHSALGAGFSNARDWDGRVNRGEEINN
jgi:hypothetical protein